MPLPMLAIGGLAAAKGISGWLRSRGKDKGAQTQADNQNKMNAWNYKKDEASWRGERGWQQKKRGRSHAFRSQLLAAIMGNAKYGMAKLFPGFAQLQKKYEGPQGVVNPYEAAGAPPKMEAAKGGVGAALGAAAGGAIEGGMQAYGVGR